jgi:hypothetical protein
MLCNVYEFRENRYAEKPYSPQGVSEITFTCASTAKAHGVLTLQNAFVKSVYCVAEYTTCNCAADTPEFSCAPHKQGSSRLGSADLVGQVYGLRQTNVHPHK